MTSARCAPRSPWVPMIDDEGARARRRSRRRRAGTARRAPPARHLPPRSSPPSPGTKPRSSAPTREAAVCSTEKPFQPSLTAPSSTAALAASASTAAPSGRAERAGADDDQRLLGALQRLGEAVLWREIGERLGAGAEIVVGVGQVGLLADQRRSGNCPARQRLRMRALSTAASRRGLAPTISSASACSMPAMVALNR